MLWEWTSGYEETNVGKVACGKNIWFLLNIDILKDREISIYLSAVLYDVAYFEAIYLKCISVAL